MTYQIFNRPPRIRPHWPCESVDLPEPPDPPQSGRPDLLPMLLPLAGAGVFAGTASLAGGNPLLVALPTGTMALLGLGLGFHQHRVKARHAAAVHRSRTDLFEDQLETGRTRLRRLYDQERTARSYLHPETNELLLIAGSGEARPEPRLWERRITDDDFLDLRVGIGSIPASSQAYVPPPMRDGIVDQRLYRIATEYATLRQVPITVPLGTLGSLGVAGPRAAASALTRALLWQAVVLHAPGDLRVALFCPTATADEWEWLRWLPHTIPLGNDSAPGKRMLATSPGAIGTLGSELLDQLSRRREQRPGADPSSQQEPRILLLIDGADLPQTYPALAEVIRHGASLGMICLLLVAAWHQIPEDCAAMLELDPYGGRWVRSGEQWPRGRFTPDQVALAISDQLARRLAGIRLLERGGAQDLPRSVRLFDLLGIRNELSLTPPAAWSKPLPLAWHPDVPIGAGADGVPVCLDLNEGRHGPHGIIAGATGAGKSVLLQTMVAALCATHSPERLQLLLIDFKGGASLMMFEPLPHTAGLVTDLEGRMAERAVTSIKSELRRRKSLLKALATTHEVKVENIRDYRHLAASQGLPPLPNLLIVVDEFDELARTYPDFVAELIRVVKQGRSLGVHLLLATQQPSRAVTDEIRSQLSFFVALRLGNAEDSRTMLLKPDAAFLTTDLPGRAYMRSGGEVRPLQVAVVTGVYQPTEPGTHGPRVSFLRNGQEQPVAPGYPGPSTEGETDLDLLVRALRTAGSTMEPAYPGWLPQPIWQPPLPLRLTLRALVAEPTSLSSSEASGQAQWQGAPIGLLDVPQECRRQPFAFDFATGHVALVGAPGSGKTTLLRTLVLSLAQTFAPQALWCYLVDAGGQGLGSLIGLPHVGDHLQAREVERVRRLLRMLDTTLRERQELLRAADAADLVAYRLRTGIVLPELLVVIDKLAVLREEFGEQGGDDELLATLIRLARLGRSCGMHLVISADRATDLSYRLLALIEHRLTLRQPELHDYSELLGTRVITPLPAGQPGRALVMHPDYGALDLQVALPSMVLAPTGGAEREASPFEPDLTSEVRDYVTYLATFWGERGSSDPEPMRVELLPELITVATLATPMPPAHTNGGLVLPVGRESRNLHTAWLALDSESPHALVIGPRRSGKTSLLHLIVHQLTAHHDPAELGLYILDGPRSNLSALRELAHTRFYADDEHGAGALSIDLIAARMAASPPRRLVLIDDYNLCRERMRAQFAQSYGGSPNLLDTLGEMIQVGGRYGEHLLLAASVAYADDNLLRALDAGRSGLIFWPGRYDPGTRLLGITLPLSDQRSAEQPPGRALLVREDEHQLLQLARV
ncbi:FtsK/SpoIIIE domain-containing protein [Candidatus Chloroploca mongolica]|nr:FtsK/SpoIIIE domain-containing protein [Candidatus Chloroploca mongolica]